MGTLLSLSKSTVSLDVSEWALLAFGALLVVGLIIEYRAEHGSHWMKFGALLVIIGVAGELLGDGGIFLFSRRLQTIADQEIATLTIETGDAKSSAVRAADAGASAEASAKATREEANAVGEEAKTIEKRLDAASGHLNEIEEDVFAQGPRWRLLERGKDVFIKSLSPFAGQRVTVVTCANDDGERSALEQLLITMFREAGWGSPGYTRWSGCPIMLSGGNEIYFVSATDDSAEWAGMLERQWVKPECGRFNISHDASNTLCDVLFKLGIFTTGWREKQLPTEIGIQMARAFFGDNAPDGPAEMAYKDPGRIFILIGPNTPMYANKNAKPK